MLVAALAECRRLGLDFEEAWAETVREGKPLVMTNHPDPPPHAVRWPTDRWARQESWAAITSTKDTWARAYYRLPPTAAERAVIGLFDLLEAVSQKTPETRTPGWGRTATAPAAHMRTRPPHDRQPVAAS